MTFPHSASFFMACRLAAGILLCAANAQGAYDVTIVATGSSSGGAWVGDTWTASADNATVLASEVATHLGNGPTVINTGGGGTQNGDITVSAAVSWSANELTLTAARNIAINANLNDSGTSMHWPWRSRRRVCADGEGEGANERFASSHQSWRTPARRADSNDCTVRPGYRAGMPRPA